ncbi:MAG: hypothetical protein QM750_22305 [Rubrivivax sp.]
MRSDSTPNHQGGTGFPWFLLWVIGAVVLAGDSLRGYGSGGDAASLVLAVAWLCWAVSWYTKPFQVDFKSGLAQAFRVLPIRPWMPKLLWNLVTIGALAFLIAGLALRLATAA